MPTFNNLVELAKYVQDKANKALKNEVAQVTMEEMSDTIKEVEYPKYESHAENPYERQMDNGGLSDIRNMEVEVLDDNTIAVYSVRMDGDRDVSTIFATGIGYSWKNSGIYNMQPFPRNFYADTVERMLKNKAHLVAFREGMARLGIKVE